MGTGKVVKAVNGTGHTRSVLIEVPAAATGMQVKLKFTHAGVIFNIFVVIFDCILLKFSNQSGIMNLVNVCLYYENTEYF